MKRYRDKNGILTCTIKEIDRLTEQEGREYFTKGNSYLNKEDGRIYIYIEDDEVLIHLQSYDGYNLFIPFESCGTFLPDIASDDLALIKLKVD